MKKLPMWKPEELKKGFRKDAVTDRERSLRALSWSWKLIDTARRDIFLARSEAGVAAILRRMARKIDRVAVRGRPTFGDRAAWAMVPDSPLKQGKQAGAMRAAV